MKQAIKKDESNNQQTIWKKYPESKKSPGKLTGAFKFVKQDSSVVSGQVTPGKAIKILEQFAKNKPFIDYDEDET